MNKYRNILGIVLVFVGLALTSCNDDDNFTPGPQTPDNCMTVYFDSDNKAEYVVSPDEATISLKVSRLDASQAAVVPIVVNFKDSETISIPASVEFAEGETSSTLKVDFPNLPQKELSKFSVSIDEAYVNHYAKLPGSTSFTASLLVSTWINLGNVTFKFDPSLIADVPTDVEWLDGLNRFRFRNFLDSGEDLEFYIDIDNFDYDNVTANAGNIQPLNHFGDRTYFDWGSEWWFGNDGNNIVWYPMGGELGIEYIAFLDDSYSAIDLSTMKGTMTSYIYYTDGTNDYNYIYFGPTNN